MKKDIKLNIKNAQIAEALQLGKLKEKLAKKKASSDEEKKEPVPAKTTKTTKTSKVDEVASEQEAPSRRKARSRSVFSEENSQDLPKSEPEKEQVTEAVEPEIQPEIIQEDEKKQEPEIKPDVEPEIEKVKEPAKTAPKERAKSKPTFTPKKGALGPTGRHINDLLPPKRAPKKPEPTKKTVEKEQVKSEKSKESETKTFTRKDQKGPRFKEFRDIKPTKRPSSSRFDSRGKQGFGQSGDSESRWRKKRSKAAKEQVEDTTIRPTEVSVRVPISIKDLAAQMKLKASQLISKLFLQGIVVTINDSLDDETTLHVLGDEFGCQIHIDTTEEERIRVTDQTVTDEIQATDPEKLEARAPVVAFMGHVDHGKTSLIDYIRKSNVSQGEAGSITQHIGAFLCKTDVGNIAVLDTPGHEAFSAMRARGANVTDIVVLVVAGDEGIRKQTEEAIDHALAAGVSIVVAINKCDKPNFNAETVYRQLADKNLLPESWGGSTITVSCSAVTGEGIKELLEMLALQSDVLELKANPDSRARGSVLESELHKGLGAVTTVLVQNGTLNLGDSIVFGEHWGRVKTMRDEVGHDLKHAGPSAPVEITGLSGLPDAGEEFIVVSNEKEARDIASKRSIGKKQRYLEQSKKGSLENLLQQAADKAKKDLRIVLRADVQGSLEALKTALGKIESEKADVSIIASGVGEISESDVLLAAASNAIILGFHTKIEAHADSLLKQHGVQVFLHDIIYHAVDEVKGLMTGLLDKVAQENEQGKAEVRAVFKASQLGKIAGCVVIEGAIHRNDSARVVRGKEVIWKGSVSSLKRGKDDVKEVLKGNECGILLNGFSDFEEGDILEAFETVYISQKL